MTRQERRDISIAYYAQVIVAAGIAKGQSKNSIRADLRYVCEYSEVLGRHDVEKIMEVGLGQRCA